MLTGGKLPERGGTMAGIKSALKRVMDHRNVGTVVAKGKLSECDCHFKECQVCDRCQYPTNFIIIRLEHDKGLITQYDHGSDIRIYHNLKIGDRTILMLQDNWTAVWEFLDNSETPNNDPRIMKQLKT